MFATPPARRVSFATVVAADAPTHRAVGPLAAARSAVCAIPEVEHRLLHLGPSNVVRLVHLHIKDFQHCSQAAESLIPEVSTVNGASTEEGGAGLWGRANGVGGLPTADGTTSVGGTVGKRESFGTGRVARDRRGLVHGWPEVRTSSCTSSPVPDSPSVFVQGVAGTW